ncbi:MAG: hypothetical protein KC776_24735 [Myxococcales bacterium]|nr:hypothetical protein [Myxococcales bacterium]
MPVRNSIAAARPAAARVNRAAKPRNQVLPMATFILTLVLLGSDVERLVLE